jgi:hypothetical protein
MFASQNEAYINWLLQEYAAYDMGAGRTSWGIHCRQKYYEHISVLILPPTSSSPWIQKLHTCRMRSILEASYIANWVSWTTNKRSWSEWNWTRVSPTGDFPAGSWIGMDFLFSHVSMLHTHSCTTCINY